ncbi:MAG: ADP-ribosylglycohydrolase family protein, partial [Clostridia bacterium]
MRLDFETYKDKMAGCWMGKNIGGVLGAPFEGKRGVFDVDFYVQELSGHPPANDDLDLQLVWLNAVEEYGSAINASILGEYWLTYIIPNWVEYGSGKNNLRMGIVPPLSGYLENPYRDSCGCFIRSELWACIAPGNPQIAAKYAYEDAIVDHSSEGMHAEVFCAALQSAAFVETDFYQLIEIGLSYIPKDSGVTNAVREALQAFQDGVDFKEARIRVLKAEQGSFGVQNLRLEKIPNELPPGKPGYDAPGNIGIMIIGLLYGENDFGKSICIANNCGEDTDCTCATLGALLGIINGRQAIPQKWVEPIGDYISTCCIN